MFPFFVVYPIVSDYHPTISSTRFMPTEIDDTQLLEYNKQGLIPGPHEKSYQFLLRVRRLLKFSSEIYSAKESKHLRVPFKLKDKMPLGNRRPALDRTNRLYGFAATWVPSFYSNQSLAPWHGGSAWIPNPHDTNPTTYVQLRKAFQSQPSYLWIYRRNDLLTHEYAHIARMSFDEPKYEELLAYKSSESSFRRFFGPIVVSPIESWLFIAVIFFITFLDYSTIYMGNLKLYASLMWLKLLPIAMIAYGTWRLYQLHGAFSRAWRHINTIINNPQQTNAIIFRLSDAEIDRFAGGSPQTVIQYAQEQKGKSLRWRLLAKAYF